MTSVVFAFRVFTLSFPRACVFHAAVALRVMQILDCHAKINKINFAKLPSFLYRLVCMAPTNDADESKVIVLLLVVETVRL